MKRFGLFPLLGLLLLTACPSNEDVVSVGAKPFAEQYILSEMLVRLLQEQGLEAEVRICDNIFVCQREIRQGRLDLMVEYSGTALQFVGAPRPDREAPIAQVRQLFEPLGLRWLEPLGFDNGYRILVPASRAAALGLESIGDLDRVPGGLRVACPPEFLRRSGDGMASLLSRYGLRLSGEPLLFAEPGPRFQALMAGRADVAIGYATDGEISGLGLLALEDPFEFFPPYEAAIVVRENLWQAHPEIREPLAALSGNIAPEAMRRLNYAVNVEGREPAHVAQRFIEEHELIDLGDAEGTNRAPDLVVAVNEANDLRGQSARGLQAIHEVFPGRPIKRLVAADVVEAVVSGRARLAIMGAERFFAGDDRGEADTRVEAVAVVGTLQVHVVTRADAEEGEAPGESLTGRVGLLPPGTSGGRIGTALLTQNRSRASARAEMTDLLSRVERGQLDAALLPVEAGAAQLTRALANGELSLRPLGIWLSPERAVELPYLRRARIAAGTYAHQPEAIDTVEVQVVLIGPAHSRDETAGAAGPAGALPLASRPLTTTQIERLAEATGILEVPHASLPSAWTSETRRDEQDQESSGAVETVLNLLVVGFLIWLFVLILRRPKSPARA